MMKAHTKRLGRTYGYLDHISFFLEPIPLRLGTMFEDVHHPTWYRGAVLYEHIIDASVLKFAFDLIETSAERYYNKLHWRDEFDLAENKRLKDEFLRRRDQFLLEQGLSAPMGYNASKLTSAYEPFSGLLTEFFQRQIDTTQAEELRKYYACNVPHVMLYPDVDKVNLVEPPKRLVLR